MADDTPVVDVPDRSSSLFGRSPTLAKEAGSYMQPGAVFLGRASMGSALTREIDGSMRAGQLSQATSGAVGPQYLTVSVTTSDREVITQPLLQHPTHAEPHEQSPAAAKLEAQLQFAYNVSWVVNILLFGAKFYAWWISGSKSVLASLVDSFVDLVSQMVIFIAEWQSKKADPRFPVGKARLETIGVLACACIMSVSAYEVVQDSAIALYDGLAKGDPPELEASVVMYAVLGSATALKLMCYIQCVALQSKSDSMLALAEDHLNDIVSNVGAAATSAIAIYVSGAWWADPAGGILISLFILWRWYDIAKSQIEKIVGRGAPAELLDQLKHLAESHHTQLQVDYLRAYHFGAKFMVEAEVVMPVHYTLKEVHDISLNLQHRIEALPEVERCHVHVDYERRPEPEHRTDRVLAGLPVLREESLSLGSPTS